jgi:hypothetical protein
MREFHEDDMTANNFWMDPIPQSFQGAVENILQSASIL